MSDQLPEPIAFCPENRGQQATDIAVMVAFTGGIFALWISAGGWDICGLILFLPFLAICGFRTLHDLQTGSSIVIYAYGIQVNGILRSELIFWNEIGRYRFGPIRRSGRSGITVFKEGALWPALVIDESRENYRDVETILRRKHAERHFLKKP